VRVTAGGEAALALAAAEPAAAIVADLTMPGLDGAALVARLRARGDRPPVVLVNAAALPAPPGNPRRRRGSRSPSTRCSTPSRARPVSAEARDGWPRPVPLRRRPATGSSTGRTASQCSSSRSPKAGPCSGRRLPPTPRRRRAGAGGKLVVVEQETETVIGAQRLPDQYP